MQLPKFESLYVILLEYLSDLLLSFLLGIVYHVFAVHINWWRNIVHLNAIRGHAKGFEDCQCKKNLHTIFSMAMMHLSQAERHNHDIAYKAIALSKFYSWPCINKQLI